MRADEAQLILTENELDVLVAAETESTDKRMQGSSSLGERIIKDPDLSVIDLDFACRGHFSAAGSEFWPQSDLVGTHEAFEGCVAHLAGKLVPFTEHLKSNLRFEGQILIIDQRDKLDKQRLQESLCLCTAPHDGLHLSHKNEDLFLGW